MLIVLIGLASAQTQTYQDATILSIQPKDSSSRVHKTTDAPPPSSEAAYDVKVKIGDKDYVGRYRHASDYVPSNWEVGKDSGRPCRQAPASHLFERLSGKEVAMPIVKREPASASSK